MFHGKIWTHATKIRNTTESVAAKTRASIKRALASMSLPEIADSRGQRKNTAILGGLIPSFFVHLDTFLLTLVPQSLFFLHLPTLLYSLALQGIEPLERAKKNLLTAPHYSPDLVTHGVFQLFPILPSSQSFLFRPSYLVTQVLRLRSSWMSLAQLGAFILFQYLKSIPCPAATSCTQKMLMQI